MNLKMTESIIEKKPCSSEPLLPAGRQRPRVGRLGFTLIELLIVITIILIVSAVALPTIIPALSHRQVSEAARLLQGALAGARDAAIRNNAPAGIRLLPDPTINGVNPMTGNVDGSLPLAANRIVPLEIPAEYSEGVVTPIINLKNLPSAFVMQYPNALILQEGTSTTAAPTSWFWNIRVGDKVQINNAGPWYTVVGPTVIGQGLTTGTVQYANTELFVNVGPPGPSPTGSKYTLDYGNGPLEYLLLVNGQDDNGNGWVDEGFDGIDNDGDYATYGTDEQTCKLFTNGEWEPEVWLGTAVSHPGTNQTYTIQRRPAPATGAREVQLPSNVVIDLTTWNNAIQERSRLPVNPNTGYVDILIYPSGKVVLTTIFSTPAVAGMASSFAHFWIAERSDVLAPTSQTAVPFLPLPVGSGSVAATRFSNQAIKGEYRLVTLFIQTGQVTTNETVPFDTVNLGNTVAPFYNANLPYTQAQQGARGVMQ